MRHMATYMLLVLGGNAAPTKEDVTAALAAVGVDVSRCIARVGATECLNAATTFSLVFRSILYGFCMSTAVCVRGHTKVPVTSQRVRYPFGTHQR